MSPATISLKFLLFATIVSTHISGQTFTNPILDKSDLKDPFVFRHGSHYYMLATDNPFGDLHYVTIRKSEVLTNFRNAQYKELPSYSYAHSGKIYYMDGELYMYFYQRLGGGGTPYQNRMFVIKAVDSSDPMGEWEPAVRIPINWYDEAEYGSVMNHGGKRYFVWTSPTSGVSSIYIGEMTSPTQVVEPFSMIREPKEEWECPSGRCYIANSAFIHNNNVTYLIYTANGNGRFPKGTCFGQMSIPFDKDPLIESNWVNEGKCVYSGNAEEIVTNPINPSFVTSPDGTETWMMYGASLTTLHVANLEKIEWAEDGAPIIPRPHGVGNPQPVPSGQEN